MSNLVPSGFPGRSWVSALLATAAAYFFFLLFAEFAFLELASDGAPDAARLRWIMLGLGGGGLAGAVLAARVRSESRLRALSGGFLACAASAFAALAVSTFALRIMSGAFIGISLGWTTVTLAASLRAAAGDRHLGLCIGGGTGLAYAACNLPGVFHAGAVNQTVAAGLIAGVASVLPMLMRESPDEAAFPGEYDRWSVARWTAILMALVWLDSAAFYIIQHTAPLRAATWHEPDALWMNAAVHLAVALGAGVLLDQRRRAVLVAGAVVALALAAFVLGGTLPPAVRPGWLYSAGVSAYSTLLVEYPARSGRAWVAATVFAVAGWLGSALGIGMAQDLQRIPESFVVGTAAALAVMLMWRARQLRRAGVAATAVALAVGCTPSLRATESELIAQGREVYIAEGCIHCHSQYVRPRAAAEVELWGPATVLSDGLAASPPLFGTRRQGPDLSHVGNRRSAEWNRLHLINPREISPGSRMPSYAHLFRERAGDGARPGDALVAYLVSLGRETLPARLAQVAAWKPELRTVLAPEAARRRFDQLCAHCHGTGGRGDGALAARLSIRPPDWAEPEWRRVPAGTDVEVALSRIIKFGLPGSPMAGHEYLPDADVVGLARHVQTLHSSARGAAIVASRP